ncbi:hypothetical protein HJC23_012494 [Cyclotella cryptica]|uniref:Uncharacterized protein n=1 Tax=Cyclotella cryptica TaxID=29204 RepID=A0ABD3PCK1_9STRA|eukprot:CCRYP_016304-RA/>CCRYP_016304-RA protein AED:0.33 eAED:0.33 QI:297/1/1/1/1/1/3/1215/181
MSTSAILRVKPALAVAATINSRRTVSSFSHPTRIFDCLSTQLSAPESKSLPSIAKNNLRRFGHRRVPARGLHAKPYISKRELGAMSADDLEKRINRFKCLATEAKLCIQDCDESAETNFDEEFESAKMAVDSASIAYSELLEELALTEEGIPMLNEIRKMYAPSVENLREELKGLLKMKPV